MALLGLPAARIDGRPGRASCVLPAVVGRVDCRERSVRPERDANSCRDANAKGEGNNKTVPTSCGLLLEEQYGGIWQTGRSDRQRRECSDGASILFGAGGECFVLIFCSSAEPSRAVLVIINKVKMAEFGIFCSLLILAAVWRELG